MMRERQPPKLGRFVPSLPVEDGGVGASRLSIAPFRYGDPLLACYAWAASQPASGASGISSLKTLACRSLGALEAQTPLQPQKKVRLRSRT